MIAISPQSLLAWIDALGWTLLHFLWQGALLGLFYLVARPLCGGVAGRYRLGMIAVFGMALCPALTLAYLWPAASVGPAGGAIALPVQSISAGATAGSPDRLEFWMPCLVGAWFIGATLIAARAFSHWRRLAWLVRNAAIPLPEYADMLGRLTRRFGISRRVRLLASLAVDTPTLIGCLRPVILLPLSMLSGFTPQQIELIIAHELGHVRRWDYLANLLQVVVETVLFYHPVVHWVSRDVRDARENCCDDLVLSLAEGSPIVYANTLADLEQLRHEVALAAPAPALAASGGVLVERIRRIVGVESVLYDPLPRSGGWPILMLIAAGILATLQLRAPEPVMTTLANAPALSVAAISGNPRLTAIEPARAPSGPAARVQMPVAAPAASASMPAPAIDPPAPEPVAPVARPRITAVLSRPQSVPGVGDIRARVAALPTLALPETTAAPAPARNEMPVVVQRVQPDYPLQQKLHGTTGSVDLQFAIERDGSVGEVRVLQSTPENVFDRVAVAALKKWRFASAGESGRLYTQTFAFTLGAPTTAADTCREVTGSHICRHMAADDEIDSGVPGILELGGHK